MANPRLDHVTLVVEDMPAAIAFFLELGLELEGEMSVEGGWVDRIASLDGVRADIAMVRTPDGHVDRLRRRGNGLIGEVVEYEDYYRLWYVRGPDGTIVALAESLRRG